MSITTMSYSPGGEAAEAFWRHASELNEPRWHRRAFRCTQATLDEIIAAAECEGMLARTVLHIRGMRDRYMVLTLTALGHDDAVAQLEWETGGRRGPHVSAELACADDEDGKWYWERLFERIPETPAEEPAEDQASITFTHMGQYGPVETTRVIEVPDWAEIRGNYSRTALAKMDKLIEGDPGKLDGKVGVLHGPTGTGKTTFLRALAEAWKDKAWFSYIIDTDRFFGDPSYMMKILLDDEGSEGWHVILCEDAEEFISPSAKHEVGEALSRLLNLGDGMLGQGLNVLFFFTTNAPLKQLHPAVTRDGRCFSNLEVPALTEHEAARWIKDHGGDPFKVDSRPRTLAELYGVLRHQGI